MTKHARLEARVSPEIHTLVKRAAEIQGQTVSEFVVSATREAAMHAIERAEVIYLSAEGQRRFAAALIEPAPLAPALERAIARHTEVVRPLE
jgi:uncharacterized protein (DUF1778 family)